MESGNTKKRIEYLDVAKGIAMIGVIIAHFGGIPFLLNRICFSFHMPLFFLISGYFFKKGDMNLLLKRKAYQLLRPYVITSMVVIFSSIFWNGIIKNETITVGRNILEWLWAFFYGSGNPYNSPYWIKEIGAIWFLPALFFSLLILGFCLNKKYSLVWIVLLMWVGSYTRDVLWLPFSIQAALVALGYLYIGYNVREYNILEKLIASPVIVGAAFVLWVLYILCDGGRVYIVQGYFANGIYYETFFSSVAAFCVIWIAYIISKKSNLVERFLKFIGQNSLIIMCAHLVELNTFPWWLLVDRLSRWGVSHGWIITILICLKTIFAVTIVIGFKRLKVIINRRPARQDDENSDLIKTANRNESWINLAYTLVVFLLLVSQLEIDGKIRSVIFSFHVPLLIILCGYCYEKKSIKEIIFTDLKSLFAIYIGVEGCNLFVSIWKELFYNGGNIGTIGVVAEKWFVDILEEINLSSNILENLDNIGFIWLIPSLIFGYLFFSMVLKLKNRVSQFLMVIGLTLFGVSLGKEGWLLPCRIDISMVFVIFLYVGYSVKNYALLNKKVTYKSYIPLILIWGIGLWSGRNELAARNYPCGIFYVVAAIAGAFFVIQIIREIEKVNIFQRICRIIGANVFLIIGIHSLDLQVCNWSPILEGRSLTQQLLIKGLLYFSLFILFVVIKELIRTSIKKFQESEVVIEQTDTAFLISIICLIVGHAVPGGTSIRNLMFSFQMPLLFILIGLKMKKVNFSSELSDQLKADFKYLVIPYVLFHVADSLLGILFYGETVDIVVWVKKLIWASGVAYKDYPSIGVLWIINILFWAKTLFSMIQLIIPERFRGITCVSIAIIGYMLGMRQRWLILSLDVAMVVVFYLYIGSQINRILNIFDRHRLLIAAAFGVWIILWDKGLYLEFAARYYPSFVLTVMESLCGSVCVMLFSRQLNRYLGISRLAYDIEKYAIIMLAMHHISGRFAQLWGRGVFYDCFFSLFFVLSMTAMVAFAKSWLEKSSERRERAYLVVLNLYIIRVFFNTIMLAFPWPWHFDTLLRIAVVIIVCTRVIEHKWVRDKRLFVFVAMGSSFVLSCFSNGYIFLVDIVLFIIGAIDIPYKKILKSYCICGGVIMGLAISSALTGATKDLIYSGSRHSFGVVYPTDFAAHVVFLLLAVWVTFRKIPNRVMAVLMGVLSFFLYHYCRARCGAIVMGLSAIAVLLIERIELREISGKATRKIVKWLDWLIIFWMPLCAASIVDMSVKYSSEDLRLEAINKWISSRLYLAHNAIDKYGIKAFGTAFEMIGGGNDTVSRGGYNFVDSSYCMILLQYGVVILVVICILYMWTTRRAAYVGNRRLSMAMALIAIHSIIEHHLTDLAYNPFLLVAFAELAHTGGNYAIKEKSEEKEKYFIWLVCGGIGILALMSFQKLLSYARTIITLLRLNIPSRNILYIVGILGISFISIMAIKKTILLLLAYVRGQKPNRKIVVACVLYMTAGVGTVMFLESVLRVKSENFTETLDRGTQIIEAIRENENIDQGKLKICVDDIPELYERRVGGITNPVLTGASLISQSDAILLTNIENDLYILTDGGFLFGELSNQQGIYTKNENVIKVLEDYGIKMQNHYSVRKDVDLLAMAVANGLELGETEGLLIEGPESSLIHGPWVTIYKGRLQVDYRIKLVRSVAETGEVAKVRLSAESGNTILQEKSINREDFDENGFYVATLEQGMQSKEGVEFLLFANEGTVLEIEQITYGKINQS
ncbi:MAG: acyltransferase family protein [Hungatella sp.]|nr:acyltransferase family protein [Hungatella sp.]